MEDWLDAEADTESGELNESLRFGFLVHDVSRLRRVVVDRELKPLGVTRSQWWVLAFLSRRDGMTQTALAADLDLTKVAVGGHIERLEAAGYVIRRADVADGRSRRIFLSKSGHQLVRKIRDTVQQVEKSMLAGLAQKDLEGAVAVLRTMKTTLLELISSDEDASSGAGKKPKK